MDRSFSRKGPALLQLHKWDASQLQLNLSEFREAFISPTRELLLLLSYRCEALLLPLTTGESVDGEVSETCCNENLQTPYSSASSPQTMPLSDRLHSKSNISCQSEIDFGSPKSLDHNTLEYNDCPFIFDVKSVAWGACGDTYNQQKDLLFREFLLVSGSHGVMVHAFYNFNDISKTARCIPDGEFKRGKWVEWGPSLLNQNLEREIPADIFYGAAGKVDEESTIWNKEGQLKMQKDTGEAASKFDGSKRWLRSFFTNVDAVETGGNNRWLRFPEKSSFPCSAKVVSFCILESDIPLQNLLSLGKSVINKDSLQESVPDHQNNLASTLDQKSSREHSEADNASKVACVDSLYRCTRVFSSDSHFLIGFVMKPLDSASVCATNGSERCKGTNVVLIVAQLFSWGLRWASVVKLEESNVGPVDDWKDFCFSDNLVTCLTASGLIFLYDAISGKFVARLDILRTCELHVPSNIQEAETSDADTGKVTELGSGVSCRTMFRSLVVASNTSLLAAVDECGVIYVICVGDFVPNEYYGSEKLLPHFRHLGRGMLVGWEVGGIDVGHGRMCPNLSGSLGAEVFSKWNGTFFTSDTIRNDVAQKIHHGNLFGEAGLSDLCLNVFSAQSKITDQRPKAFQTESLLTRKVFLPTEKFGWDDCICFSSLGITRFTRKRTNNELCSSKIVHFDLQTVLSVRDDRCLNSYGKTISVQGIEEAFMRESVGCCFQGSFYLVTRHGLSVFLPSISVASKFPPAESSGYLQPIFSAVMGCQGKDNSEMKESAQICFPVQVEILDRVVLFEGPGAADCVCLKNGWDLTVSRMRRLQIALDYLKFDEIYQSLEMLGDVMLAEEGILRLLFAAVHLLHKNGNDNEVSAVLRLLALATRFATKMIHKYGLLEYRKDAYMLEGKRAQMLFLPPVLPDKSETENSSRLREMAHFLEIIRNWQYRLSTKFKKSGQGDNDKALSLLDPKPLQDESQMTFVPADTVFLESTDQHDISLSTSASGLHNNENLALMPLNSVSNKACWLPEDSGDASALLLQGPVLEKTVLPLENPKEMMARWKTDNLDLKNVVKDALLSGRLPLAVLQLHLQHSRELNENEEQHDTFSEVRDIGRAIAYDLFLKGESGLAIATLQRLGEDVEICLKQLLFGTMRRSLRAQIAEEMRNYGYLRPYEWKILERISLIERLYPSSNFWKTFVTRQKNFQEVASPSDSLREIKFQLLDSCVFSSLMIECGEVDGVVLGSWTKINENASDPVSDEAGAHAGYWAAAAVWSNAWDQRTFDRIVLDQPLVMGVHVPWESQLEYYMGHNDWDGVFKLLDLVPAAVLSNGSLQIALDCINHSSNVECSCSIADSSDYVCSVKGVDAVSMDVPYIKFLRLPAEISCSGWIKLLLEQELAKKMIFLKEHWEVIEDIIFLLARSGIIHSGHQVSFGGASHSTSLDLCLPDSEGGLHDDTVHALHKIFICYCVKYYLPNLLDLYLDHHKLALDNDSLGSLMEATDDCQWAKWLLLSRIKGWEYDASFANARAIMSRNVAPSGELSALGIDEIVCTVDDIAEGGGEVAALATLMYASAPIQKCLSSGSVTRLSSSSAQCTLENLRSVLQRFPTLWNTLVASCFRQDTAGSFLGTRAESALSEYLNWRDSVFFSAGRDTSLLQMLPYWFPKAVRRLVQLYIQGPLGCLSFSGYPSGESFLHRDIDLFINADEHTEISAISWEAIIQKHIEEELYHSSIEGTGLGLEHCLHRGRALAAFDHLLALRVEKLKLEVESGTVAQGQTNVQGDVQTLLAPLTQSEESLLSFVIPLAITHFEDSVLVASSAFLLELCGLSASMLRVDVASLRRISSFYKSNENGDIFQQMLPKGYAFHAVSCEGDVMGSLARALADEYVHRNFSSDPRESGTLPTASGKQPQFPIMLVLHHLEKASLPQLVDDKTCGYWLLTGDGDGTGLRSQQKAASQHWNLVTLFCQMHQLPLSTKYLAMLARDNDWVGFLSEAQLGGYPFDRVIQVASKEFSDPRLKVHILTVLKDINSRKKTSSSHSDATGKGDASSFSDDEVYAPAELFRVLAECEKRKNPGEFLLLKAKDLSWSILAMIASCFPDVSPLSCLTVWLEITAARETSSIKVNDIASQIAENVAAAVEATNFLPTNTRAVLFHYNRKSSKRRRLTEPESQDSLHSSNALSTPSARFFSAYVINDGDDGKHEDSNVTSDLSNRPASLSKMVAVLCEQCLFLPLLRAFELYLPSSSLLPFIRALQAFSQMRLSEASAHLGSFSARIKEEPLHFQLNLGKEIQFGASWITATAVKAADAVLSTCPSPYEKRCVLQLLAATDFGDGGSAASYYRRLYWKINLAEPSLQTDNNLNLGSETRDDGSLLTALEKNRLWEQARNWARQLETKGAPGISAVHHVTETQAESMVAEWKEFLWDVPEERMALWGHCQTLFIRYSFPALQAGSFFLKHAEAVDKELPPREIHELLLLSLQWLSGMITQSHPVYPLHLLREIETRVWLLAVESEAQVKSEGELNSSISSKNMAKGSSLNIIDHTASIISKMDNHINAIVKNRTVEKHDSRDPNPAHQWNQTFDTGASTLSGGGSTKAKRRAKALVPSRQPLMDSLDKSTDFEDSSSPLNPKSEFQLQDESMRLQISFSKWEERVEPVELERAVVSLMDFGQITAAKQLQHKLSPGSAPSEFVLVDVALKVAAISTPSNRVPLSMLDEEVSSVIQSYGLPIDQQMVEPLQVLEGLSNILKEGSGCGQARKIIAVVKAANVLGLRFAEAYEKQPVELLRLLSLKAQESFEEACLLVQTHSMPAASIAQILAESFLKGLLAAHHGGYIDSQKEEGPAPLLWRLQDFLKWAKLCPSEPEIGHALMRLVITGQEIPHACEVELLILSHHFYKSSACLDGVDVLVALAATRVEAYVLEGDFACLARLITGVGNFHALNFILGILIENGQLDLLLQKYSAAADTGTSTAQAVRSFRMAVLTSLRHFNPDDLDAFAMVYNHFDMKHETAVLLESRAEQSAQLWLLRHDKDQNEDLLDSMCYYIEAAEVHSSIDAGNKTRKACAQASLVSLQIRMPDSQWLNLSDTNARRALVEQSQFQEALIVAEAYGLNQPSEWALVLWNHMLKPELIQEFVAEFVAVLPLQPSMLLELAKFYRAEVAARGDQSQFSVWLTGGGLPADWLKYLGRSFRCLLKRTRDLRLRSQLATIATGFGDVIDVCIKVLDRVPDNAGPLVLKKGHGGAYLPLM